MPFYPFPYPSNFQIDELRIHEGSSVPRTSNRTRYASSPGHRHRGSSTPKPIVVLHDHDDGQASRHRDEPNYSPPRGRNYSRPQSVGRQSRSHSPRRNHRDHRSSSGRRSRSHSPPKTRAYNGHTAPRRSYTYARDQSTSGKSAPARPIHERDRRRQSEAQFPPSNGRAAGLRREAVGEFGNIGQ
ncbi:hypothetical protein BDZ89DRAFT_602267 [Hymenopellis radicata]|nr:hypothetical protein BDZ89DRAFT_602267 [Hymenopellis radicata]